VTADLTKTMMLRRTPHMLKKNKKVGEEYKHHFEGGANSELDKGTYRSNLDSKANSSVKYPVSVIGFYWVQLL